MVSLMLHIFVMFSYGCAQRSDKGLIKDVPARSGSRIGLAVKVIVGLVV